MAKVVLPIELQSNIRQEVAGDTVALDEGIAALERFSAEVRAAGATSKTLAKAGYGTYGKAVGDELAVAKKKHDVAAKAFIQKHGEAGAHALAERIAQAKQESSATAAEAKRAATEKAAAARKAAAALAAQEKAASDAARAAAAKKTADEQKAAAAVSASWKRHWALVSKAEADAGKERARIQQVLAVKAVKAEEMRRRAAEKARRAYLYGTRGVAGYKQAIEATLGTMGGMTTRVEAIINTLGSGGLLGITLGATAAVVALGAAAAAAGVGLVALAGAASVVTVKLADAAAPLVQYRLVVRHLSLRRNDWGVRLPI